MTHAELLKFVDINSFVHPKPLVEVVKLHTPNHNDICANCLRKYPCPTIQIIKKTIEELE